MIAEVCLIRHGKTRGNLEGRYVGRTDEPLDPSEAARLTVPSGDAPDLIFISPMRRCRQTADILFPGCGMIEIPEFTEIDFGTFEYHTWTELSGRTDYQTWIDSGGRLPFPDGESQDGFRRRVLTGFGRMCRMIADFSEDVDENSDGRTVRAAAVVHGGTIMALLSELGVPRRDYFSWHVENGCGYIVRFSCGRPCAEAPADPDAFLPEKVLVERAVRLNGS